MNTSASTAAYSPTADAYRDSFVAPTYSFPALGHAGSLRATSRDSNPRRSSLSPGLLVDLQGQPAAGTKTRTTVEYTNFRYK